MPENFLQLSAKDRVATLRTAASNSGRSGPLMEKDTQFHEALDERH